VVLLLLLFGGGEEEVVDVDDDVEADAVGGAFAAGQGSTLSNFKAACCAF